VAAEGGDRMVLYGRPVERDNMAPGELIWRQAAFARVRRATAAPATLIQLENGQWTK